MKQFLVMAAVLPLLLVFFLQFALDQQNDARIGIVTDLVSCAKEEARQEGCFTGQINGKLRSSLAAALDISPSDVVIEADSQVKYRITETDGLSEKQLERGLIKYKVTVPIGRMMAAPALMGLRDINNTYYYTVEGSCASERLRK